MRSRTFCLFQSLLESSSKMRITTDRPARETERRWVSCGIPFMAVSSGIVTCCSTSSAALPGHCVMTQA